MLTVLCEIARCPLTGAQLEPVESRELASLNERIAAGSLHHADGAPVAQPLSAALVAREAGVVYRVDDGIAALLPQLAVLVRRDVHVEEDLDPDKRAVQDFYESFGWRKQGNQYLDTLTFVDLRPVSMEYRERCHRRVSRHLPPGGRFFLDAASGPVHHEAYRSFSNGFDFRVCVDFSQRALREAQQNLGAHGLYVLGDVTRLPFRTGAFDAAVSLHTLYHVPADEQRLAFEELHRVLKPGASAVVVYRWARPRRLSAAIRSLARRAPIRRRVPSSATAPALYSHAHTYRWFCDQRWPFEADVLVWRSVGRDFLRRFIHQRLLGRSVLHLLYALEEAAPRLAGRIGELPMIVIRKRA